MSEKASPRGMSVHEFRTLKGLSTQKRIDMFLMNDRETHDCLFLGSSVTVVDT